MNQLCVGLIGLKGAKSIPEGVEKVQNALRECGKRGVEIACFSETYLPGLRGASWDLPAPDQRLLKQALSDIQEACRESGVAAVVGMEWVSDLGLENRAF